MVLESPALILLVKKAFNHVAQGVQSLYATHCTGGRLLV